MRFAVLGAILLFAVSGCSRLFGESDSKRFSETEIVPTPTSDSAIAERWELDRGLIPVRDSWRSDGFHDQFEGCRDRGFGGRTSDSFMFIDIPPEPHTREVVRKAIAEQMCFAGKAEYVPPGPWRLEQAHFTTREIDLWAGQLYELLRPRGIEFSTMDKRNADNRINVGLVDLGREYEARELLEAAGIPQHAVHFEHRGYITRRLAPISP